MVSLPPVLQTIIQNKIIMKKLFITLIAFFGLAAAFAQTVPNAGFEEWTDNTHPVGWNAAFNHTFSVDFYGSPFSIPVDYNAANQSTNAHSGTSAVEVVPQQINAIITTIDIPGVIQLGQFNTSSMDNIDFSSFDMSNFNITQFVDGGIACNQLPAKATAWVLFNTVSDSLRAGVVATRCYNGERQVVAQGEYCHQGAINEYTQIEIPFVVKEGMEGVQPDTINIIFSNGSREVDAATRLFVDDVELVAPTAIFGLSGMPVFSVQPNPATDVITVLPLDGSEYALRMYDTNGKLVRELYGLQNETRLSVSDLTKGVYFLQVKQGTNVKMQKVLIN